MNKINIILFTFILLIFILYVFNNCKSRKKINEITEPFAQVSTLNMQYGLNNDGNIGASGGGGAGGVIGGAVTDIKSNGGLPLTSTSGFDGGDGINNVTTAGGGGGAGGPGRDNNDSDVTKAGLGGIGINVEIDIPTQFYCSGGAGGKSYVNGVGY